MVLRNGARRALDRSALIDAGGLSTIVAEQVFIVSWKVYRRRFRVPVRSSCGLWENREGILLRLEDERGNAAYGEIAPIEDFGTETLAGALTWCASVTGRVNRSKLADVPKGLPCTAWAVASALAEMEGEGSEESGGRTAQAPPLPKGMAAESSSCGGDACAVLPPGTPRRLPVSALLPRGKAALAELERLAGEGFATFKLKIGATDFASEVQAVARVVDNLPDGAQLRLDANGALDAHTARRWLEVAEGWPVEFIEQPLPADVARRESVALAHDSRVALAIDEAVRTPDDVKRWRDDGWPGVFVIKPALGGPPAGWLEEIAIAAHQFVFSSALESAVGLRAGIRQAFGAGVNRALGYGVAAFFEDDGLGGGLNTPFVSAEALAGLDAERIWARL